MIDPSRLCRVFLLHATTLMINGHSCPDVARYSVPHTGGRSQCGCKQSARLRHCLVENGLLYDWYLLACSHTMPQHITAGPVTSHNNNSQTFNLRVSGPRNLAHVHFKLPFESSNLPGAGPISPD